MLELNRAAVISFFESVSAGHFADARAMVEPDGDWWTLGRRAARPSAAVIDLLEDLNARSVDGLVFAIRTTTAEGDRVAAEVAGQAEFADRGRYDNLYHFLFRLADGRISEVWEYYDTALSDSVFRRPSTEQS